MMKLILENWRNYAASIIDEEFLGESLQQVEQTVVTRGSKLMKGWAYDLPKGTTDFDSLYEDIDKKIINTNIGKISGWNLCGHIICAIVGYYKVPNDIEEAQKKVALLWAYKQTISGLEQEDILTDLLTAIATYILSTDFNNIVIDVQQDNLSDKYYALVNYNNPKLPTYVKYSLNASGDESKKTQDKTLVERFFQWNRFVRDGKRDLNSVSSFSELFELVKEAEPKYKAWQEKQESKDVEKGKEVLLDDKNWQVVAIHNKGAACQLGKGTDWCTAAPGLNYFKEYYQENDPLFYILDKSDGQKYQFHFGSKQYMDKDDNNLYPSRYHVGDEIINVLDKVVPEKYSRARKEIKKKLEAMEHRKTAHLNPQSGERW